MEKNEKPYAATDLGIFRFAENMLQVYLVRLKMSPFPGKYSLPGALLQYDEDLAQAAYRVYREATGQEAAFFEQVYTFSAPNRDIRHRSISTAYMAFPRGDIGDFHPCDKYDFGGWFNAAEMSGLAYDHDEILALTRERIAAKLNYTTIALLLLPNEFTLTEMQRLYEHCLERTLDKRNFRKKILSMEIIAPTGKMRRGQKARPAMLYQAVERKMEMIPLFR